MPCILYVLQVVINITNIWHGAHGNENFLPRKTGRKIILQHLPVWYIKSLWVKGTVSRDGYFFKVLQILDLSVHALMVFKVFQLRFTTLYNYYFIICIFGITNIKNAHTETLFRRSSLWLFDVLYWRPLMGCRENA